MTLNDLLNRMTYHIEYDLAAMEGPSPTVSQNTVHINEAIRFIGARCFKFDQRILFTPTLNALEQDLESYDVVSRKVIDAYIVSLPNGNILNGCNGLYGLWGWGEFIQQYPNYATQASGTPWIGVKMPNYKLLLWPPPASVLTPCYIAGQYMPKDLSVAITNATNATPIVVTTDQNHDCVDGEALNIGEVEGNTAANGTRFAKVTGYTVKTLGLYSDKALTTPVVGTGAYTLGGQMNFLTRTPDIPRELQECLAYYAAVVTSEPTLSEQAQFARMQTYNTRWVQDLKDIAQRNRGMLQYYTRQGTAIPTTMWV